MNNKNQLTLSQHFHEFKSGEDSKEGIEEKDEKDNVVDEQ